MTRYSVSFLYNEVEDAINMVIYLDLIFLVNFIFDVSLLLTVDLLLKRKAKMWRVVLGALVGETSMLTLFVNFDNTFMFLFKIGLNLAMVVATFSFKEIRYTFYNAIYLYLVGMILGGFEYYLYNEFQVGGQFGIKYLIVLVLSPIALIVYYKLSKKFKNDYNNRHSLKVVYDECVFEGVGYLDSGNKLVNPINGKIIVLIEKEYIHYHKLKLIPVPYNALNHHGLLYCFSPKELYVDGREYKDIMIGLSEVKFNIEGCNALLNARMENI